MKKAISLVCSVFVLACTFVFCVSSVSQYDPVEISFKIGDDTLTINGQSVKTEKPYVYGVGVTLVPVRVITESFGADVDWEEKSQKVTLTLNDQKIELWIGEDEALVNSEPVKLLAPAQLSEAGSTMVPLRFISETFDAEVGYDEESERVTVFKAAVPMEGMKFFEDEQEVLSLQIPENYVCSSQENNTYEFSLPNVEKKIEDDYIKNIAVYEFHMDSLYLGKPKPFLDADKRSQNSPYLADEIRMDGLYDEKIAGKEAYTYQILYRTKDSVDMLLAKKCIYKHADLMRLIVIIPEYASSELVENPSVSGGLQSIATRDIVVKIPEDFSDDTSYNKVIVPTSAHFSEKISVELYSADEKIDLKQYLEDEALSVKNRFNQAIFSVSDVVKADIDEADAYKYTVESVTGDTSENIVYEVDDVVVLVRVNSEKETPVGIEKIASAIRILNTENAELARLPEIAVYDTENSEADTDEEPKETEEVDETEIYEDNPGLKDTETESEEVAQEKNVIHVTSKETAFDLPEGFEIWMSEDGSEVIARDTESSITISLLDTSCTMQNDDEVLSFYDPFIPQYHYTNKTTVCSPLGIMEARYEEGGWTIIHIPEQWDKYENTYRTFDGKDLLYVKKEISDGVYLYQKLLYFRTDINKNTNSGSKQMLHAFTVTYTDLDNPDRVEEVWKLLRSSVADKYLENTEDKNDKWRCIVKKK